MDLDRVVGSFEAFDRGMPFRQCGFPRVADALILQPASAIAQQASRFQVQDHVAQHPLNQLMIANRHTESFTLLGIFQRGFQRSLDEAGCARTDGVAPVVQRRHCNFEAFAFFAQTVGNGNAHIIKENAASVASPNAKFAVQRMRLNAFKRAFDDKRRHAALFLFLVGIGYHQEMVGKIG